MSDAPERIWIEDEFGEGDDDQWTYGTWDVRNYAGYDVEYIRADRIEALTAELDERVQTSASMCDDCGWAMKFPDCGCVYCGFHRLEKERDRLREAIMFWLEAEEPDVDAAINMMRAALKGETR